MNFHILFYFYFSSLFVFLILCFRNFYSHISWEIMVDDERKNFLWKGKTRFFSQKKWRRNFCLQLNSILCQNNYNMLNFWKEINSHIRTMEWNYWENCALIKCFIVLNEWKKKITRHIIATEREWEVNKIEIIKLSHFSLFSTLLPSSTFPHNIHSSVTSSFSPLSSSSSLLLHSAIV